MKARVQEVNSKMDALRGIDPQTGFRLLREGIVPALKYIMQVTPPHITVPMGYVHHLPVGLCFFAGKLQEGTLIEAAYSYEQATKHRKAPVL